MAFFTLTPLDLVTAPKDHRSPSLTVVASFGLEVGVPWFPTFSCIARRPGYPNLAVSSKAFRTDATEVRPVNEIVCVGDPSDILLSRTSNPRYLNYLAMANFGSRYGSIRVSQVSDSFKTLTVELTRTKDGMSTVRVDVNLIPLAEASYFAGGGGSPCPKRIQRRFAL